MGLNASKKEAPKGGNFQPIEAGNYIARLVQVVDLGVQAQRPYKGEAKPPVQEVMLTYELCSEFLKDEDGNDIEDKPRWISERMPFHSMQADRAKSTARIKALDPSNQFNGDLAKMVGRAVTVTVVQSPSKKDPTKIYSNVGNVTPAMKGIPVPELVNPSKVFDLTEPDLEIFGSLPDWIQETIKENLEYNGSKLEQLVGSEPKTEPQDPQETAGDGDEGDDRPY